MIQAWLAGQGVAQVSSSLFVGHDSHVRAYKDASSCAWQACACHDTGLAGWAGCGASILDPGSSIQWP